MKARWKGDDWTDLGERPAHETPGDVAEMFAEEQSRVRDSAEIFADGRLMNDVEVMDSACEVTTWRVDVCCDICCDEFSARRVNP